MAKKQEFNLLGEAINVLKDTWRHRKGNEIPAAILDTMDALFPKDKPRPLLIRNGIKKNDDGWHMIFKLRPGVSFNDIIKRQDYFNDVCPGYMMIEKKKDFAHFHITAGEIKNYYPYEWSPQQHAELDLPIPIGYTAKGLEVVDLSALPHMRVGGTTFTGKSNFLHNIFISLAMLPNVRLAVIDLALLEFSYTQNHAAFASDTETALQLLEALEREMHRRRKVLNKARVVKIQEYKKEDLPFIVLIIDEFAFMNPDSTPDKGEKKLRQQCQAICSNLAALARKVGIHLIIAMQRPDMKILPGQLKANLPGALSFKTINKVNSEIILDNGDAAELPDIQGRAFWQVGNKQQEVQVMHLPINKARKILKQLEGGNDANWIKPQAQRLLPRQ